MNNLLIGMAAGVILILLFLGWLAVRNPVLVKIGVRNIPRRPTQSALIVVGLTLSTVIILSALATGDTLTHSVRSHAVQAYGKIDEIIAPPLVSQLIAAAEGNASAQAATAADEQVATLERLGEGGLTSVLAVVEGGLPGIAEERYAALRRAAEEDPLIDAVSASIVFPTLIRNVNTGQSEPLGFIFAVDNDYDTQFGLTAIDGTPVAMESLQTGVGNIFAQAANLFALAEQAGSRLGLGDVQISNVAVATAAVSAALTGGTNEGDFNLVDFSLDVATLRELGVDTTLLEEAGIDSLSLASLGLDESNLQALGITTTVGLETFGINAAAVQGMKDELLDVLNLNTLGSELDRVLAQVGLQLRQGDVYLNRLGAERLDAHVGDVLDVYIGPLPIPFRVKAIVDAAGPLSALTPVVMLRLDEAQKLLFMNGRINNVLVSNLGDELEGIEYTGAVSEHLRVLALDPALVEQATEILRRPQVLAVVVAEAERVEDAFDVPPFLASLVSDVAQIGNFATSARSMAAALADESASPTGPVDDRIRTALAQIAVRLWLLDLPLPSQDGAELRAILAQLNQFDVLEPLSKATVVAVAGVGGVVFSSIFSIFGVFSILAGILLIFLIFVMMAAERRSEMGMARAIGVQRRHLVQMFVTEGVLYDLAAAALGVALGVLVSYAMVGFVGRLISSFADTVGGPSSLLRIRFQVAPASLVIAYCAGVLFTFVVVTIASWRVSRLNIVAAIRGLPDTQRPGREDWLNTLLGMAMGPILLLGGLAMWYLGRDAGLSLSLVGLSLATAGMALLVGWWLSRTHLRKDTVQRIVYTTIGVALLVIWGIPWDRWPAQAGTSPDQNNPWILLSFVLTPPMIILGAILVLMFNADAWTWGINHVLGGIGPLTPVLKTAIAYPLSSRFRTGMAILLFAVVISTVTIMSVVIAATQTLITPDSERYAGFEIAISPTLLSFFDPLEDLAGELARRQDIPAGAIAAVGAVTDRTVRVRQAFSDMDSRMTAKGEWARVNLVGLDDGYLAQASQVYFFQSRAPGYATDDAIWQALRERDDVAVLSADLFASAIGQAPASNYFEHEHDAGRGLALTGIPTGTEVLPELYVTLRTADEVAVEHTVQIIGAIAQKVTLADNGLHTNEQTFELVLGERPVPENFYVKAGPNADVHEVAQMLERTFLANAVDATILAESFAQGQAFTRGILQLFQGFMALGLLVGIAGLGVISTRSVVERRQQVGMLRAIGFQPGMVAVSFLLESSFIALAGILIGVAAGVLLGQSIVGYFYAELADGQVFTTPWLQIGGVVLFAYVFSLLTTILPAYQAARIYPAEALRYE